MIAMERKCPPNARIGLHGLGIRPRPGRAQEYGSSLDAHQAKRSAFLLACGADGSDLLTVDAPIAMSASTMIYGTAPMRRFQTSIGPRVGEGAGGDRGRANRVVAGAAGGNLIAKASGLRKVTAVLLLAVATCLKRNASISPS